MLFAVSHWGSVPAAAAGISCMEFSRLFQRLYILRAHSLFLYCAALLTRRIQLSEAGVSVAKVPVLLFRLILKWYTCISPDTQALRAQFVQRALFTFWQSSQHYTPILTSWSCLSVQVLQLPEDSTFKHLSSWLKSTERMFPLRPHSSPWHWCCRDLWAANLPQNPPEDDAARRWHHVIVQESHRADNPPSLQPVAPLFSLFDS